MISSKLELLGYSQLDIRILFIIIVDEFRGNVKHDKKKLNHNLRPFARSLTRNTHEYYMTVRL